MYNEFKVRNT